jgi:ADP-ribosyl-[dinitrogen reductase] hydrolase
MDDIDKKGNFGMYDTPLDKSIAGCILGTAVGDALGLPAEGLRKRRARRIFGNIDRYRFIFGRGMTSDDTEHICIVAQALVASGGDLSEFRQDLARRLKQWLLTIPAGVGLATARSIMRMIVGISAERSGVFSAGNGPAMRSAIIGVSSIGDLEKMRKLVRISTRMTHIDPKAEYGAVAVALAASYASQSTIPDRPVSKYCSELREMLGNEADELLLLIELAAESASGGESTEFYAAKMGWAEGVSGYIYATVPAALHAWFRHPKDFASAVGGVIACGGDTDTTAAITGGIIGAKVGPQGIPEQWLSRLIEWPRSVRWMSTLAEQLAEVTADGIRQRPVEANTLALLIRNIAFLILVLGHGFRRGFPPY